MTFAASLVVAMLIEAVLGWPARLFALVGHPVTWLGWLIDQLDVRFNRSLNTDRHRRLMGGLAVVLVVAVAGGVSWLIERQLPGGVIGIVIGGVCAWPLVAARSMYDHVAAVMVPLKAGDIEAARRAVAMIVGRDPDQLDEAGVARAALESLAENTSDGVVAPIFWGVVFGLPGIAVYKAINTLDSMIGHRTPRHEAFGCVAARLDDVANLIPARLTGLLFAVVSGRPVQAFRCMLRDARQHRSPNAGWPEAAMAGALSVSLSGPRVYGDRVAAEPWLNEAGRAPVADDVARGLRVFVRTMGLVAILLAIGAVI